MRRLTKYFPAIAILACSAAHAETLPPDWYAGFSGDVTWLPHTDTGYGGNVDLGYRFWPTDFGSARIEGELGYHRASGRNDFGDTHYYTYMGNLYYDFNLLGSVAESRVTPYLGVGLGDTTARFGQGIGGNAFAYQFMAGLTLTPASTPNTDWSLGWRYQGSDSVDNSAGLSRSLNANSIELGVRFHF